MMCLWLNFIEQGGWFRVSLAWELLTMQPAVVLFSSLSLLEKCRDLHVLTLGAEAQDGLFWSSVTRAASTSWQIPPARLPQVCCLCTCYFRELKTVPWEGSHQEEGGGPP